MSHISDFVVFCIVSASSIVFCCTVMCICIKYFGKAQLQKRENKRRLKNAYRHRKQFARHRKQLKALHLSPSDFNQISVDSPVQSMGASNEEGDQGISRSTTTTYPWSILMSEPSALNLHQLHIGNTNPAYSGDLNHSHNSAFDCATAPHEISNEANIEYIVSASNDLGEDNPPPYESIALFDRRSTLSLERSAQALGTPHQMNIGYSNPVFTYPHRGHSAFSSVTIPRDQYNAHKASISHPYEVTVSGPSTVLPPEHYAPSATIPSALSEYQRSSVTVSGQSTVLPPEHYAPSATIPSALSDYQQSSTKVSGQSMFNVYNPNSCRVRQGNEEHDGNSRTIEDPLSEFDYSAIL